MTIKQVIVIRKDLKMRRGKEISQGSHASMAFMVNRRNAMQKMNNCPYGYITLTPKEMQWMDEKQTKVTVQVNSEQELQDIFDKAEAAGLQPHMIVDAGLTEFNGVPTKTCLAIGPNSSEKIDPITGHLSLY